ncbi:SDR family NAD(P)-dependent oxidoreductase [Halioxenophilus aromaticivorans]|uniref:SDR family oxidoreductase n=1 Tax=Halioxenophilus aromaticivorans TaxID=1306992 RepID=A0AAV3U6W8_9ALTE
MSFDFSNKVVLITGGASGLGLACAQAFCSQGAKVAIADLSQEAIDKAVDTLQQLNGEVIGLVCNVSQANQVDEMVTSVVEQWGRLDIAVNNAGISSPLNPVAKTQEEDFDRVMAVNLKGVWLCMRAELQQMEKQGGGAIVNMASALSTRVFAGGSFYVASKFAVAGLTRTAAVEYAESGIRINAVCPGNVATPLVVNTVSPEMLKELANVHAMKRLGEPEEIASAVMFLASDAASFNTGTILPVDGGWTAQ